MQQTYDDGKYTVIFDEKTGSMKALRYGEEWQDLTGNNLIYWMLVEQVQALEKIKELEKYHTAYVVWSDKTEWVQETATAKELGKHRADVLRERILALEKDNLEQCRINAMGAEREARLMARIAELEKDAARYVMVDRGVLQMVLNALERDAQEGKESRREIREELIKSIKG